MSESTGNGEPTFSLPEGERTASRELLNKSSDKTTETRPPQRPETLAKKPSDTIADEILAEKGQKTAAAAMAHAKEGNMDEALAALRIGQEQPPTGLVDLATFAEEAAKRGDSKPLKLDSDTCISIAQSFVGQDKERVLEMLDEFNLSKETKKAILDNIPEGSVEDRKVSQGEHEIRQAQIDALAKQAKESGEQQIAALNAQIGEEQSSEKPDKKYVRFLKQQRANINHRMKNIEHWLKASPSEWTGRVGSFIYWSIVALFMIVIMEMAAINKMAGKK